MDLQKFADAAVLAAEAAQTPEDESVNETEITSSFSGLKLFHYEHNYCQNSYTFFEEYGQCELNPDKPLEASDNVESEIISKIEPISENGSDLLDVDTTVTETKEDVQKTVVEVDKNVSETIECVPKSIEVDKNISETKESVPKTVETIKNVVSQSPRRRSLRKHNVSEKGKSTNEVEVDSGLKPNLNSSPPLVPETVCDTDIKSSPKKSPRALKKNISPKKETKSDKTHPGHKKEDKNENTPKSSPGVLKNPSVDSIDVKPQENNAKAKKGKGRSKTSSLKNKQEEEPVPLASPGRKKRSHSESSSGNLIDSSPVNSDSSSPGKKTRLRSQTKAISPVKQAKEIEDNDKNHKNNKRKRSISASTIELESKGSEKKTPETSPKGKRKKSVSISEDSSNLEAATPLKDPVSDNKEPEFKGPSFPCAIKPIKPKKSSRRDSVRTVINDDEPPLFSQPDVLVKVKSDELNAKKEEKESDKAQMLPEDPKKNASEADTGQSTEHFQTKTVDETETLLKPDEIKKEENKSFVDSVKSNAGNHDGKDNDSENSLHIDDSPGPVNEESDKKPVESPELHNPSENKVSMPSKIGNRHNEDEEMESVSKNSPDIDDEKSIAERKPRRTIKRKEFFEDLTLRTEAQSKKTGIKQKGGEKKPEKDDGKKGPKSSKQDDEDFSDDSDEEEEDDPEKLWCICRQPHNDRFMIQCDNCEDWFHGSCVGVTRLLGRKLEKQGKDWNCPNCLSKDSKDSLEKKVLSNQLGKITEKPGEKHVKQQIKVPVQRPVDKKVKMIDSDYSPKKETITPKAHKVLSTTHASTKRVPSPNTNPVASNSSSPKGPSKSFRLNQKDLSSSVTAKKASTVVKKKLNCVTCQAPAVNGSYCSEKCIEKHASDCLNIMRQSKVSQKASEFESQRVVVLDLIKGNIISGDNAPTAGEIVTWLKANPSYMVACSSNPSVSSKKETIQKKEKDDSHSSIKDKKESDDSSKTVVRFNVRKTLKNILMERCKNADDIKMTEEEVRKIAVKIEEALNSLFKDNSFKYRAKYRSLMFNIKDPRNQGLFRKILKGDIPPDKLVRMSPEELASMELAKWREQENQHLLDMIKRGQLEQLNPSCHLKKTHKGEVEIEDDFTNIIDEIPKATSKPLPAEAGETEKPELDNVVVKDTTHLHRSHLFDLNCKICTGKIIPPPVEEITPKKVRVAHSISVDMSSPNSGDSIEKTVSKIVEGGEDSLDQEPTSTVSIGSPEMTLKLPKDSEASVKAPSSVWKGFIFMQDVAKFVTSAYKVSGQTEHLNVDVPDTIQVCGRIIPDQVWDYLSKIKQSGSKELVVIRFQAANEEESITYNSFYSYLSSRKRYGVVSNYSKKIKDFYILPLAATSPVPIVLMPFDGPGLPSPRPHLLLGVIVRHKGKQSNAATKKEKVKEEVEQTDGSYTPPLDNRSYTPPLPLSSESSINITPEAPYSPSAEYKSENTHSSTSKSLKSNSITESYTPPVHSLSDTSKEPDDDKPYDPEQDLPSFESSEPNLDSKPATENLEKHKKILDALTRQVEETDRQVNALKQLISHPDDSQNDANSSGGQSLNIASVAPAGMTSFLDIPDNLQDILNVVRKKTVDKTELNSAEAVLTVPEPDLGREGTPLPDESNQDTSVARPSDPRIKLKTSFDPDEAPNKSLSNMSVSELVEKAEKELADMKALETAQAGASVNQGNSFNLPAWGQFKEPPPPGLESSQMLPPGGTFQPQPLTSGPTSDKIPSSFPNVPFPPSHLSPGFSLQTPPPTIKGFPPPPLPPAVMSISYPPPISTMSPSWNVPPPSKEEAWPAKSATHWNEPWKSRSDKNSPDHPESTSRYYQSGSKRESFYRNKPSDGRWNRPSTRFNRNNWNKRGRDTHWRDRKSFDKNSRT